MTPNQQFIIEIVTLIMAAVVTPLMGVVIAILTRNFKNVQQEIVETKQQIVETKQQIGETKKQAEEYHREVNSRLTGYTAAVAQAEFHKGKEQERLEQMNRELLSKAPSSTLADASLPSVETPAD